MKDTKGEEIAAVSVHITKRQVHQAVRNIISNEMKLDPVEIKNEVREQAFALIKTEVIDKLTKQGYGEIGLKDWAQRAMEHRMKAVDEMLKTIVRELVGEAIRERIQEQTLDVIGAILKDGLTVSVGYNRKIKVKIEQKEVP